MLVRPDDAVLAVLPTSAGGKVHVTSVRIEVPMGWEPGDELMEPVLVAEGRVPGRSSLVPLGFLRLSAGSAAGTLMVKPLESIPVWHELAEIAPLAQAIKSSSVVLIPSGDEADAMTSAVARDAIMSRFLPGWSR